MDFQIATKVNLNKDTNFKLVKFKWLLADIWLIFLFYFTHFTLSQSNRIRPQVMSDLINCRKYRRVRLFLIFNLTGWFYKWTGAHSHQKTFPAHDVCFLPSLHPCFLCTSFPLFLSASAQRQCLSCCVGASCQDLWVAAAESQQHSSRCVSTDCLDQFFPEIRRLTPTYVWSSHVAYKCSSFLCQRWVCWKEENGCRVLEVGLDLLFRGHGFIIIFTLGCVLWGKGDIHRMLYIMLTLISFASVFFSNEQITHWWLCDWISWMLVPFWAWPHCCQYWKKSLRHYSVYKAQQINLSWLDLTLD